MRQLLLGALQQGSRRGFVSVWARCKLWVAAGAGVELVRQLGWPAACLRFSARWVVGEGGSLRLPEQRLRMVGVVAPFRQAPLRGCSCVPSAVWAARWLTREASVVRVWSSLLPCSDSVIVCISPLVGHGGWTWVMGVTYRAKALADFVGAGDSDAPVCRFPSWRCHRGWPPSTLGSG